MPAIKLYSAPNCPHCHALEEVLSSLHKQGDIDGFEKIDISKSPEVASELGIRSVPTLVLDEHRLTGMHSIDEIREYLEKLADGKSELHHILKLLDQQALPEIESRLSTKPEILSELIALLGDLQQPMHRRIGIGAVLESLDSEQINQAAVDSLLLLSGHAHPSVRVDAAYYIGLLLGESQKLLLESLLLDSHPEVQGAAQDALDDLST